MSDKSASSKTSDAPASRRDFIKLAGTTAPVVLALALPAFDDAPLLAAEDPLPSWNDTAAKKAIVAVVERVTRQGSPDPIAAFRQFRRRPANAAMDDRRQRGAQARSDRAATGIAAAGTM
jgi:hypothetical protein